MATGTGLGTRRLGDLTVSAQGLGCMGMSQAYGATSDRAAILLPPKLARSCGRLLEE